MTGLPAAVQRVQEAAKRLGLEVEVVQMPASTRTAAEAAEACGCTVGQIVKSLIFKGSESGLPYLLLVSGANRVNEEAVGRILGETLERPDAAFVREVTGYAIGGIPPFGHLADIGTWMDRDLLRYETVWAAAGTPHSVFRVAPAVLRDKLSLTTIDVD